ncbi:hypothetical protein S7711_05365 [Stachybotrys chartarum IBT 7711]|uniref:Mediator of RNA polymerase II transcription subunit 16 n=1 Tax=Stachybotrys chartarum (strain CBS 109288 / IBT 7711) TaxID=1280523 RepID=A0A084B986_STACB|nr:hypothetical protein S7711_05365 [Stachybotrys chartarum IBT 7711]KFA78152.1 hypothetical protein S40288_01375 [Stachybotrys chartarum IBT 40288]
MAATEMPLMLDNSLPVDLDDVDDLFGDGVDLTLPVRSQRKVLRHRLDELKNNGCCQAVAWSKTGTIASITTDGQNIELRYLRCSPENGSWDLSEPTICSHVKGTAAAPLVHLEWSPTSSPDLAIFDAVGRVAIVTFSQYLNQPFVTKKWDADPVDDIHLVAGCHWLAVAPANQQKPYNVLYGPATKHGNSYHYDSSFVHATGPNHPSASKSALFCVTSSGMLKMFWSQFNNKTEETTMELESVNSSDDLVTHAALASDKRFLLLAIVTSSLQMSLVKIEIHWAGAGTQLDKNNPIPQNVRLNPSLVERHLATTSWLQSGLGDAGPGTSPAELTHLQVLPSLIDQTGKNMVPPMIIAIRSRASLPGSDDLVQSIIERWEAIEQRQSLHPAFEQLGSRGSSISSEKPNATHLRRLDPIVVDKVVVGFQTVQFGKVAILTFADGTVQFRDRFTFEELYATPNLTKVSNLHQAGWTYTDNGPCKSPPRAQLPHIASLAITTAASTWHQCNYDDMLGIVQPYAKKKKFTQDWITELTRVLKIQVDYSEELHHESLMRNAPLQSCLSIMNSLGFQGELHPRLFQSKFALLDLNLRNVGILITLASNTPVTIKEKMSPLDEPEVVEALAGCAKWSLDLMAWLINCLYDLARDDEFTEKLIPQRFSEAAQYLRARNDVSLHLMLSSSSRGFLLATCRRIMHLEVLSARAIEFYRRHSYVAEASMPGKAPNPQLQQAYQKMQQTIASGLIRVGEFEKLLTVVGNDVRQAYSEFLPSLIKQQPNAPQGKQLDAAVKSAQIQMELSLLVAASPPPPFLPVIKKFFNKELPGFRKQTDPANLFYANYDLLQVDDDKRSKADKGFYVDVFKKEEIHPKSILQWRRCTRCAAVMEDVYGTRPGFIFVLGQQRKCSCGGYWGLLPKGKLLL